jgi:lysozyme
LRSIQKDLINDEGYRKHAYRDSLGLWTIGIGHLLGSGPLPRMDDLTDDEVQALFDFDVQQAENRCRTFFRDWVLLDFVRQDALLNMAFNLGNRLGAFSKMIAAVNYATGAIAGEERWMAVGREMRSSLWAKQVGDRAVRLQFMIETGTRR